MFGTSVVAYLFLAGCGSGALLVVAVLSLAFFGGRHRTFEEAESFGRLKAYGYLVGTLVLGLSATCLVIDLGRPDRIVYLFARPTFSFLSFGTYALTAELAAGLYLTVTNLLYVPGTRGRSKRVAEVVCVVLSLAVMSYTGLFLGQMDAVAFWETGFVTALFVISALSTGISAVQLVWPFACVRPRFQNASFRLDAAHLALLAAEGLTLAAYLSHAARDAFALRSVALLLGGDLTAWFVGGVAVCGIALPFAVEAASLATRSTTFLPFCNVLVLFGGFALRYCIVMAGMH